jgi:hypothetical protein
MIDVLSPSTTIAVIAPDAGLRKSLAFALEVEGFLVLSYETWCKGRASAASSVCTIIDSHEVHSNLEAQHKLLDSRNRIIMLADGLTPIPSKNTARVLIKPFDGAELLRMVKDFAQMSQASLAPVAT